MALQQSILNETSNTNWFKKSVIGMLCLIVAGLLFTAMLYNRSCTTVPGQTAVQAAKPTSACEAGTCTKVKQTTEASTFSIMPGGLSRFLQ